MKQLSTILIFLIVDLYGLRSQETDYFDNSAKLDFSSIINADSIYTDNGKKSYKRNEPLGFISNDYQRFYIHFISVIQNPDNPYEYLVYGKSKVKTNICEFQGKIIIKSSKLYKNLEFPDLQTGYISGDYVFFEDNKNNASGFFKGSFKSNWYFDKSGRLKYDDLMASADGFDNNEFIGNWISYKSKTSFPCNWGDYRIPKSGDLDTGAGEFWINEKYQKNGWENYIRAMQSDSPVSLKARKIEAEKWWK